VLVLVLVLLVLLLLLLLLLLLYLPANSRLLAAAPVCDDCWICSCCCSIAGTLPDGCSRLLLKLCS
jgi:hypothetical protein